MHAIETLSKGRAEYIRNALLDGFEVNSDGRRTGLAAALYATADSFRAEADLWTNSKRKGWTGTATQLRQSASHVTALAAEVEKLKPTREDMFRAEPREPAEVSHATSGELVYRPADDPAEIEPTREETSLTPIDGVFSDQTPVPLDETLAYLRGDTDTIPGQLDLNAEVRQMTQTFPIPPAAMPGIVNGPTTDDPFSDPRPPAWGGARYIPNGGRSVTFLDLLTPPPAYLVPKHWSWSQLESSEDCGVQYRYQRIEPLTQVPQWSLIGGDTFHKASEMFDRQHADGTRSYDPADVAKVWQAIFAESIAGIASTSPVPIDKWRASNGGKENQDWWRVEGEHMLTRFVENRIKLAAGATPRTIAILPEPNGSVHGADDRNHALAIEWPFTITVDGPTGSLAFTNIVDRVWQCSDGSLLIEDLKTGSRLPKDTAQLGAYAWGVVLSTPHLRSATPDGNRTPVMGTFYDARKAIWTPAVDLLAAHPWDELVYRLHSAEAKRRAGLYTPHVSDFCVSCSVNYACPLRNRDSGS